MAIHTRAGSNLGRAVETEDEKEDLARKALGVKVVMKAIVQISGAWSETGGYSKVSNVKYCLLRFEFWFVKRVKGRREAFESRLLYTPGGQKAGVAGETSDG